MKLFCTLFIVCFILVAPTALFAQYGTGVEIGVPYVAPGTITLDGNMTEPEWAGATVIEPTVNWSGDWSGHPYADVTVISKLLWTNDTLYVGVTFEDFEPFFWGREDTVESPWGGEQILIGVDNNHTFDDIVDEDWDGWPYNAPDKGPTCYKVWKGDVTLNWGEYPSPREAGWTPGTIWVDNENYKWGFEIGIYLPNAHVNNKIGFNIGGASADTAWADSTTAWEWGQMEDGAYGWFSWQAVANAGGDVMNQSRSFATLNLLNETYGVRENLEIPYVAPTKITLDGVANEPAWSTAPVLDLTRNWSGDWSGHPYADVDVKGKLLWTEDTLYVAVEFQDFEPFFWGREDTVESPWGGEQVLIGVDNSHSMDDTVDEGWGGWPGNAPDKGPTCYKIYKGDVTLDWGALGFSPRDTGWTPGTIWVDAENYKWGFEIGIYLPAAHEGGQAGFNIGGASADTAWADSTTAWEWGQMEDGAYGWFSWQSVANPGGDVMNQSSSFATITFGKTKIQYPVIGGWNMISMPLDPVDPNASTIFPTAQSDAFGYTGSYTPMDVLAVGAGYWVKFNNPRSVTVYGAPVNEATVTLQPGWNMIGGLSNTVNTLAITSDPPGMVTSSFYGYDGVYNQVTDLLPGYGYWVKVGSAGSLFLSTTAPFSMANRIQIVPTNELPPPPPDGIQNVGVPKTFALGQNYPNPFNPVTRFTFDVPKIADVKIAVYNVLGQKVKTLLNGLTSPGSYEMEWNGTDAQGISVPSGIYFVRMLSGEFNAVQKVMLMK